MQPLCVVEGDPLADDAFGGGGRRSSRADRPPRLFNDRHRRLLKMMLSRRRPPPSMEMATFASLRTPVKARLVNWLSWSVLKISALP